MIPLPSFGNAQNPVDITNIPSVETVTGREILTTDRQY